MPVELWFPMAVYDDHLVAHRDACVAAVDEAYDCSVKRAAAAWTGGVSGEDWIHHDPRCAQHSRSRN